MGAAVARTAWDIVRQDAPFVSPSALILRFTDQPPQPAQVSALMVTALRRLCLSMRPYWGDGVGPLACTWMDARPERLLRRLPALLWGNGDKVAPGAGYHSVRAARLALELSEPWLLAGEVLGSAGSLELSASSELAFLLLSQRVP